MNKEVDGVSGDDVWPEQAFVAWLVGETPQPPDGVDPATLSSALPQQLAARVAEDASVLPLMLERLANANNGESLLAALLADHWLPIRDALPPPMGDASEIRAENRVRSNPDPRLRVSPYLVYVLLRSGSSEVLRLDKNGLEFFRCTCGMDVGLLRHVLTWASAQPPGNGNGWHYVDEATPETIWGFVARLIQRAFALRRSHSSTFASWDRLIPQLPRWDVDVTSLGLELIATGWEGIADRVRRDGRLVFQTQMDLVLELGKLDAPRARQLAAADPAIVDEFIEAGGSETHDVTRRRRSETERARLEAVLRLLPFAQLERREPSAVKGRRRDLVVRDLDRKVLAVGWAIGALLHDRDSPRTKQALLQLIGRPGWSDLDEHSRLVGVALLWADLFQVAEYQRDKWNHREHITGVLARLTEHLTGAPDSWALSAREIVRQGEALGRESTDLLVLAAAQHATVADELRRISEEDSDRAVRDVARGICTRLDGGLPADEDSRRWLADTAARAYDGIPFFPHPLTSLSKTWIGSIDVEGALARSIRQAMAAFGALARDQGAAQEEHLTGTLLRDLENAFRDASLRLQSGGNPRLATAVSVSHRPVLKAEEKRWGCDVALLLNASIYRAVELRLAALVQVKKSEAFAAKDSAVARERWRIDVPQLLTLLGVSESSAYWLILSTGEVICVTARWLYGLAGGRAALNQKSLTLGYNEVRTAAIPMEQYLSELFLGTWVGSAHPDTIRFANGDDTNLVPRYIFNITVGTSTDQ